MQWFTEHVSATSLLKCLLQREVLFQISTPLNSRPEHLFQVAVYKAPRAVLHASPKTHVFGVQSAHCLAPASSHGATQAQAWAYPRRTWPNVLPASLHGYTFLFNYSCEDILISPRQLWKENRIQTTNINPGREPGLRVQGSILQRARSF